MKSEARENGWRILIDENTAAAVRRIIETSQKDAGRPADAETETELNGLRPERETFMVGRLSLAAEAEAYGRNEEAGMHALAGFQMGEQSLPEFDVALDMYDGHTRCFLELARRYVIALEAGRSWAEAAHTIRRMTEWDLSDRFEMRQRLGPVLLRKGDLPEAVAALEEGEQVPHPTTLWYERALAAFLVATETPEPGELQKRYETATRHLQRAIIENPYVAEALPAEGERPKPGWFAPPTRERSADAAIEYCERYGSLWRIVPGAFAWLNWVQTHPSWISERTRIWALDYAVAGAANHDQRIMFECRGVTARTELENESKPHFGTAEEWKAVADGGPLPWEKNPPRGRERPGQTRAWWDMKIPE